MSNAEIISALIKLPYSINPGLNRLFYFIVGTIPDKESTSNPLKGLIL